MRTFGKGLAALTLATSGVALAVMGASPAMAGGGHDGGSLVNVEVGNVIVHPQITLSQAANICNNNVNILAAQLDKSGKAECTALSTPITKAFVIG